MRGPDFMELRAFELVARYRSFSRAADQLDMSRSALSLLVKNLEQRVGVQLLNRTTRSVAPTEAGQVLLQRLGPALLELVSVVDDIGEFRDKPAGIVRVLCCPLGASLCLEPHLAKLSTAYPDIKLEICIGNNTADLVAEGFDAAVRMDGTIEKDLTALKLSHGHSLIAVAAPTYLNARARPAEARDLERHKCISVRREGQKYPGIWRLTDADGGEQPVSPGGGLLVNDDRLAISAAVNGLGIALVVDELAAPSIRRGELEPVLPALRTSLAGFYLCYPKPQHISRAFRGFLSFLKQARHARLKSGGAAL
ncbi:LysR family transcriptional regulator [Niveispirillum sp.]|uniref:LysR family transcriptional regulator n=1 Tax=Niveispirillum sp. TaxID=1917217 RepID=UPI001B5FA6BD|nr:LysR family transcriptional regulator [Niveispirillum sp.]MBP7336556.1 LysR family transcriptional regulator [Niveispirillum sp.]